MRVFSYGGGVQSNAVLVLSAQGVLPYKQFVFSNVGADSEHPDALEYIQNVVKPYAKKHGLEIIEIEKKLRSGQTETLWGRLMKPGSKSMPIPVFMSTGAPAGRACTSDFKVQTISKWLKQQGATKENPAISGIGISTDEAGRARSESGIPHQKLEYPLLDLRLTRQDCVNIVIKAGLPKPPKSSCFFCPFHTLPAWQELHDKRPDLFQKSVLLEQTINEKRKSNGLNNVYLTRFGKPLDQVVDGSHQKQLKMFEETPDDRYSCGPFVCSNPL